jgi:asparagine synthase (glutamine-hydrolysing)
MCGIVGIASKVEQSERTWLAIARDTLTHRGPDDAGDFWLYDKRVGLAHRRLSILDLSPLGHQPMHLQERGISIVFNGEIYNFLELRRELKALGYDFRSHSDTEVLLTAYAQWGTKCLSRLNGMFAFAIYDDREKILFLARDRAGEKPLFYRQERDAIFFASELKALLANPILPRLIDPESLDCYLAMGFVPGGRCILKGYKKLPPAHALTFDLTNGNVQEWRYWQIPEMNVDANLNNESFLVDQLEELLEEAVGCQLVSDVPVGILLSGGVDSSLVTAMAVRRAAQVRTFSIGFPGHAKLNEIPHARLVAKHFGTEHTELMAEPTTADLLPTLVRQFDEPIVDSSMFPTWLVSQLVRKYCSVALGGDGGDELFGGYEHYSRLLWMQHKFEIFPALFRRGLAKAAEYLLPVGIKGRNWLMGLDVDFQDSLPLIANYFDANQRRRLMDGYPVYPIVAEKIRKARIPRHLDLLQRSSRMDFENYMADDILVKVDRASMLNSLEVRAPFLDYRVIEFAFSMVPTKLKADERNKKILLKKLAAKVLPPEFDRQRKQGFSIPLNQWLKKGPYRELFWDTLTSADCMFNAKEVHRLLKGQDNGYTNSERLFALVQFDLWRKIYGAVL